MCKAALIRGMHHLNLQCDLSAREMCACLTRQWALLEQDRLVSALSADSVQLEETSASPPSGEDVNTLLAEDLLGSEETLPSGEDSNTSLVAEEGLDSRESSGCPKAQQTSQDQPG